MSSIFTYDPSPAQPSSPWANPRNVNPLGNPLNLEEGASPQPPNIPTPRDNGLVMVGVKGLASEPQVGSTEYKLHLLKEKKTSVRMEQLTTQLLWRLQQSSSFCPSTASGSLLSSPQQIRDSLQDSQGALYELGVADDGTFIGLLDDELEESLDTLGVMAGKLGCGVTVLRKVAIGELTEEQAKNVAGAIGSGEWDDREDMGRRRQGKAGTLWVAEAFIKPIVGQTGIGAGIDVKDDEGFSQSAMRSEQLRVSLTGPTTSGKSTLLGTLTTSQEDNGRGKSRLSLFRHRHELVSGVTSSVAQEIVGYRPYPQDGSGGEVVNYSSDNVSSWTDIHTAITNPSNAHRATIDDAVTFENGRIVFLSDTPGHPRYRRTTIRSLVGWAPHYAVVLIPADEEELGEASKQHLHLVLKLDLRVIILLTKLDVARKTTMRNILSDTLTILKENGRVTKTLVTTNISEIGYWGEQEEKRVREIVQEIKKSDSKEMGAGKAIVPIVFTSSVTGQGIGCLHALLRALPIPKEGLLKTKKHLENQVVLSTNGNSLSEITEAMQEIIIKQDSPTAEPDDIAEASKNPPVNTLFHIEEVYALQHQYTSFSADTQDPNKEGENPPGAIVCGHLKYGKISIGDELVIGPFPPYVLSSSSGIGRNENKISGITRPHSEPRWENKRGREQERDREKNTGSISTTPSSSPYLLLATSAGRKTGWISDEEGTGVSSSGDEVNNNNKRRLRSNSKHSPQYYSSSPISISGTPTKNMKGDFLASKKFTEREIRVQDEWVVVKVVSIRCLRLPVSTLIQGEAGTIGIVYLRGMKKTKTQQVDVELHDGTINPHSQPFSSSRFPSHEFRLRKGMVLLNLRPDSTTTELFSSSWPQSYPAFTALFKFHNHDYNLKNNNNNKRRWNVGVVGSDVVIYVASVRAAARIVNVVYSSHSSSSSGDENKRNKNKNVQDVFSFSFEDEDESDDEVEKEKEQIEEEVFITFEFLRCEEWMEVGSKVLVVSGQQQQQQQQIGGSTNGGSGKDGYTYLDGIVGTIVKVLVRDEPASNDGIGDSGGNGMLKEKSLNLNLN